ncbi:hypothetical protein MMC17_009839 [Xylographa soralifera]|nr:hypothetical protein [Xylographa soralifera]
MPTSTLNRSHKENGVNGDASNPPLNVAIVGGGIIGVMTALGLLRCGMRVTVYERADDFPEVGAGIAFTGVARECMQLLNPRVLEALKHVGEENKHPLNRYWDGFNPTSKDEARSENAILFRMSARELAYWGCLRSMFLREMARELPDGVTKFGKELVSYVDDEGSDKVVLRFADGSVAEADAVIGCDGIHSRMRVLLLGEKDPASHAYYTHKVAYRAIVPISDGITALGDDKSNNQCVHMGPDAHIVSFPVNKWTLLNIFIFKHDPKPWPDPSRLTASATKDEVAPALKNWSPAIKELVDVLPEQLSKWAIFDTADHPASTYARGRVCLAGDAAHASSPFHGAGACMGVEDALVLATTLQAAMAELHDGSTASRSRAVIAAFQAFSDVRLERSQWLVSSSRDMGDIYQWRYPATGSSPEKCKAEFERRSRNLWEFDVAKMVAEAVSEVERRMDE